MSNNTNPTKKNKIDWNKVASVSLAAAGVTIIGASLYYGAKRTSIHRAGVKAMSDANTHYHEILVDLVKNGTVKLYQAQ